MRPPPGPEQVRFEPVVGVMGSSARDERTPRSDAPAKEVSFAIWNQRRTKKSSGKIFPCGNVTTQCPQRDKKQRRRNVAWSVRLENTSPQLLRLRVIFVDHPESVGLSANAIRTRFLVALRNPHSPTWNGRLAQSWIFKPTKSTRVDTRTPCCVASLTCQTLAWGSARAVAGDRHGWRPGFSPSELPPEDA